MRIISIPPVYGEKDARDYINAIMNGRNDPPARLSAGRFILVRFT
jgi:hypothetical protein